MRTFPCLTVTAAILVALSAASHAQEVKPGPELNILKTSDVYGRGTDGYPEVRIPAVTVTPKGTILAFAEARQAGDHSENDIVLKRGLDGGATWQPMQLIADMGGDSLNDPCVVVLPESGRVLLMYQRYPKGYHTERMGSIQPAELGYGGSHNTQSFLVRSDDDGATWSKPEDITRSVRRPDAISVGSPGIGIQLKHGPHKGRILLPLYEVVPPAGNKRQWANCAAISDDGATSWRLGERVPDAGLNGDGDECQLAELGDGTVVISVRQTVGECRYGATSTDAGETWQPAQIVPDLVSPPCMASMISVSAGKEEILAASMPNTLKHRRNGTVFVSRDGGKSWPEKHVIYPGEFAYSCLVQLPDGRLGCLFERDDYSKISFAVFDAQQIFAR
jgi:sialidase-1